MFFRFTSFQQSFKTSCLNTIFRRYCGSLVRRCASVGCLLLLLSAAVLADDAEIKPGKLRKQVSKAMRQGNFSDAETMLHELLRIEPENFDYRLALSFSYYKQRKFVESYNEAMTAAEKNPARNQVDSRVRSIVGAVLLQAGRLAEARKVLDAAIQINPNDALAVATSAMLDYYDNQSKKALGKLRRAAYLQPNEPDYIFSLAQIAARLESYKEAADAYERFLRVAPETDFDRRDRIIGLIAYLRYIGQIKSLYEPSGERETTVVCQTVNNRPVIEVRINNRSEPLRFVLDTGSGMTVLSTEAAERLNIKPVVRGGMARAIGGGGKFPIVYGFVESLRIGDVQIDRVPIYIRPFQHSGDRYDGYIGLSVIAKFLTTIDYKNKTLTLARNVEKEKNKIKLNFVQPQFSADAVSVPLRTTSSGFLSSEVKLEGVAEPLNFIFDTGASISVVSAAAAKRHEISRYANAQVLRVFGAAGVSENVATLLLPRLSFGSVNREQLTAAVLDLDTVNETTGFEQAGILGGNFLLHYRLTLNLQNSTVTFEPNSTAARENLKKTALGGNLVN